MSEPKFVVEYRPSKFSESLGTDLVPHKVTKNDTDRFDWHWVKLRYVECSISSMDEFEKAFRDMLKRSGYPKALYLGRREQDEKKLIHYHVMVNILTFIDLSVEQAGNVFNALPNECRSLHVSSIDDPEQFWDHLMDERAVPRHRDWFGMESWLDCDPGNVDYCFDKCPGEYSYW
ncbi:uncharacterized protein N7446_010532 [Penicillium canescens]|uniref:Uncharacterized protein n=1 Tax=Penicillium canescens TaxID=5083 RepID=A0AAD6IBP0_PENCN|nr:uncharacterized protein N7446_010532 [Penicillium canescens]KAJ6041584.1 hypothetical protein N7460_006974 [Penicillium canescens]KAJ6050423.1 hypothetical protein N7446_010532 [Penicillium canescens]KAJ6064727.1 hypothetical protein N7444_000380 [Penicillium canescens]